MNNLFEDKICRAADAIASADALLIGAGAGMGVDSGLPDFRGTEGFWRAYPPYAKLGLDFMNAANPRLFHHDPELAWGFYGHRLKLYRETRPHQGFELLLQIASRMKRSVFVFTSNVDGHFQRAGFSAEQIVEVHGSIHYMQCISDCALEIFPAEPYSVEIDENTMRAKAPLPACPQCGGLARPNILMFGDSGWNAQRTKKQERHFTTWSNSLGKAKLIVVECGAGTAIPTVRHTCEYMLSRQNTTLIRINLREAETPTGQISLPLGALEALRRIDRRLNPEADNG